MNRDPRVRRIAVGVCAALLAAAPSTGVDARGLEVGRPAPTPPRSARLGRGAFLVATSDLPDARFARAVVLLVRYDAGGAMGLIVNRPTPVELSALLPERDALRGRKLPVYYGGPVQPRRPLFLLRADEPPPDSAHVFSDVHFTPSVEAFEASLDGSEAQRRAYAGYAGWSPGQLDGEVARRDWFVVEADPGSVFAADPDAVWGRLIEWLEGVLAERPPGGQAVYHAAEAQREGSR